MISGGKILLPLGKGGYAHGFHRVYRGNKEAGIREG